MPNLIKKFLTTGMLMIIVLTGTVFPVWVQEVKATDIDTNFNIDTDKDPWVLKDFYIEKSTRAQTAIQSTAALLSISFKMKASAPFAKDNGSKPKVIDDSDDLGGWAGVVDGQQDWPEQAFGQGVYLILDKVKDPSQAIDSDNLEEADYEVPIPKSILQDYYKTKYDNEQNLRRSGNDVNLGLYVWGLKDASGNNPFFNKQTWGSKNGGTEISIPVTGLEKGATYVAYLKISENISTDYAVSQYFKFTTLAEDPASAEDLVGLASGDASITAEDQSRADELLFDCDLQFFGNGGDHLGKCIAKVYYRWTTAVSTKILNVAGNIFDAFLAISIGSSIYDTDKAQFVYQGWRISRDIANIFFIFILLFTAIGTILGLHSVNYKKVVTQVILVAIFINFSLFMCRIIIDTGNILARVFYNQIALTGATDAGTTSGDVEEKDISQGIANGVNPQKLFLSTKDQVDDTGAWELVLLGTVVAAFQSIMAWVLFMCAAFFVGRIGVLWLSMVFAPLAFVSTLVPSLSKEMKQIGWSGWFSSLTTASFYAPLFMFFLYLILLLTKAGLESIIPMKDSANGVVETITVVALPLMIIMGLLMNAKEVAKKMAGQFGDIADGAFKGAIGLGAMAVTGGVAAIGAKTLGANAMRTLNDPHLKNLASGSINQEDASKHFGYDANKHGDFEKWKERNSLDAQKKLQKAKIRSENSYDMRQTKLGGMLSKATGVNMDAGSNMLKMAGLNLSSEDRAGGAKAEENKRVKKQQEMEGLLKGDPNKIHELEHDKEHQEDLIKEKEAEKEEADRKVRDYKDQGADKPGHQDHQNYLNAVRDRKDKESEVTELKSGVKRDTSGNITSVTGEAGRTIAEKEYKRKNPGATDADAKAAVDPIFTQGKSLKDIDNEIKFEQKGRIKDYYHNLEQRGKNGGNIDMQTFRANFNREIRQTLGRSFNGALAGAVVGSVVPGIGTAIGAAIGGTGGAIASAGAGILSGIKEGLGQFTGTMGRRLTNNIFERSGTLRVNLDTNITGYAAMEKEAALAGNHDNKIKEFKSKYKSPGKDFFSMLGGLTGGGGGDHGGGGHDDGHGGGGHDDGHGGGGHH